MFQPDFNFEYVAPEEKAKGITFYLENFLKDEACDEREKRLYDYLHLLKDVFDNEKNYIDHGGAAKVYSLGDREICVKIMRNRHMSENSEMFNLGNRPVVEFAIMERVHGLHKGGVRSPTAEACLESGDSSAIVMEKLDAVNLQHVLNGTVDLPKNFDNKKFFHSMDEYLNALHDEMGVAHMDLFPRNIMIDKKTGEAYVIDFGRAELLGTLPDGLRQKKIDDDWNRYDILYLEMEKFYLGKELKKETIKTRNEVHQFGKGTEIHYSRFIKDKAHKLAEKILNEDGDICTVPLGKANNSLFVTTKKELVVGTYHFVMHGKDFYVGVKV